jgi:hypothetical protein
LSRRFRAERRDVLFFGPLLFCLIVGLCASPASAEQSYLHELQTRARTRGLARTRLWQVLLHYHRTLCGGWRSSADGPGFFLAGSVGEIDPEAELMATVAAFAAPATPATPDDEAGQHAQCRFPARWSWLKQELAIDTARLPEQPCPLFSGWCQAIAPEKVALVFSSAYLNSPASMYGHTFLRLTRRTGEDNRLIDYIVNFAAEEDTKSGLVYAWKGLFGGFAGHFYVMPYYMKIQEYSNIESRDLWEYELALGQAQAERLVAHTWETRSTHFNYYFATENCSYFLLELLEVADPELRLSDRFHGTVVPVETLRAVLAVPGLVKARTVRPSLRAQILNRKSHMMGSEIKTAEALSKRGREAQGLIADWSRERQARIIDAAYDLLRFREGLTKEPSPEFLRKERELLILRGRTGVPPLDNDAKPASDAPETGHRSLRLGLAGGMMGGGHAVFEELSLRVALHDFLDPSRGYLDDAELEMIQLRIRFENAARRVFPERLDLINILSVSGYDRWIPKTAWAIRVGGAQAHNLACAGVRCSYGGVNMGGGISFRLGHPFLFFLLADADLAGGAPFSDHWRIGLGGFAGAVLRLGHFSQTAAEGRDIYYFLGDRRRAPVISVGQGFNLGPWGQIRLVGDAVGSYREARAELLGYF